MGDPSICAICFRFSTAKYSTLKLSISANDNNNIALTKTMQKAARPGWRVRCVWTNQEKVACHLWHNESSHLATGSKVLQHLEYIFFSHCIQPYSVPQLFYGSASINSHLNFNRWPCSFYYIINSRILDF